MKTDGDRPQQLFGIPTLIIIFVIIVAVTFVALNRGVLWTACICGRQQRGGGLSLRHPHCPHKGFHLSYSRYAGRSGRRSLTARLSGAETNAADGWSLDAVSAVIIGGTSLRGGRGGIMNTMLGVFIIAVLNNGMVLMGIPTHYNQLVKGLLMLGAVLLDVSNRKRRDVSGTAAHHRTKKKRRRQMKKLRTMLSIALILCMLLSMAACGGSADTEETKQDAVGEESKTTEETKGAPRMAEAHTTLVWHWTLTRMRSMQRLRLYLRKREERGYKYTVTDAEGMPLSSWAISTL